MKCEFSDLVIKLKAMDFNFWAGALIMPTMLIFYSYHTWQVGWWAFIGGLGFWIIWAVTLLPHSINLWRNHGKKG